MEITNFIDFSYIVECENECFEFEFEEEFLEKIAEELDVEDFDITAITKEGDNKFLIEVVSGDKKGSFNYSLSEDKIKYIQSVVE